jgi:hypothetical protein
MRTVFAWDRTEGIIMNRLLLIIVLLTIGCAIPFIAGSIALQYLDHNWFH